MFLIRKIPPCRSIFNFNSYLTIYKSQQQFHKYNKKIISELSPPIDLISCANNANSNEFKLSQTINAIIPIACEKVKKISAIAHTAAKRSRRKRKELFTIHWKSILNYYSEYCRKKTTTASEQEEKNLFYDFFRLFARTCKHNGNTSHGNFRPSR